MLSSFSYGQPGAVPISVDRMEVLDASSLEFPTLFWATTRRDFTVYDDGHSCICTIECFALHKNARGLFARSLILEVCLIQTALSCALFHEPVLSEALYRL